MARITFLKTTHAEMTGSMERRHNYTGRTVFWELHIDGEPQGDGLRNKSDAMACAEWLASVGLDGAGLAARIAAREAEEARLRSIGAIVDGDEDGLDEDEDDSEDEA
jgi:hypothetical protein